MTQQQLQAREKEFAAAFDKVYAEGMKLLKIIAEQQAELDARTKAPRIPDFFDAIGRFFMLDKVAYKLVYIDVTNVVTCGPKFKGYLCTYPAKGEDRSIWLCNEDLQQASFDTAK